MLTYRELTLKMAEMTKQEGFDPDMPVVLHMEVGDPVRFESTGQACCVLMHKTTEGAAYLGIISDREHLLKGLFLNKLTQRFDPEVEIAQGPDDTE